MSLGAIESHFQRLHHLEHAIAMLSWDEAVMMPEGGGSGRAEALASLHALLHEGSIDPRVEEWVESAEEELDAQSGDSFGPQEHQWWKSNLRLIRRRYRRMNAVESSTIEACQKAQSRCEQAWRSLRPLHDWEGLRPLLEEVVILRREMASALGEALKLDPYDALLDEYQPGFSQQQIDPLFDRLSKEMPERIRQRLGLQEAQQVEIPNGPFSVAAQRALGWNLMMAVGFDPKHGRLDVSHHPFCGGVASDVRITTRYDKNDFSSAMMGVLHETGHAKYEQGLPSRWKHLPVGQAPCMALHESQSLLQEMQICRGSEFVEFSAPMIRLAFAEQAEAQAEAFTTENLKQLAVRVQKGFIRVDADEMTYPGHVLLRYEIERELFAGRIQVKDIPELWNTRMQELFGLDPGDEHGKGCMQDVHWPAGAFGYFPSYTLGALIAAQLFAAMRAGLPDLQRQIAAGKFDAANQWLRDNIWSKAGSQNASELVKEVTGKELGVEAFLQHIDARYLG